MFSKTESARLDASINALSMHIQLVVAPLERNERGYVFQLSSFQGDGFAVIMTPSEK